jgi:hypothetical protein
LAVSETSGTVTPGIPAPALSWPVPLRAISAAAKAEQVRHKEKKTALCIFIIYSSPPMNVNSHIIYTEFLNQAGKRVIK